MLDSRKAFLRVQGWWTAERVQKELRKWGGFEDGRGGAISFHHGFQKEESIYSEILWGG